MDKHHHYWSIYWRFLTGLAFVMSLYVFEEKNINSYIQVNNIATTIIFVLIIVLIGLASFTVLCSEHIYLVQIRKRLIDLYAKIGVEAYPNNGSNSLLRLEHFVGSKFSIASILSMSILVIAILCIALIIFSSFLALPPVENQI